jgi:hypothetical protein
VVVYSTSKSRSSILFASLWVYFVPPLLS